MIKQKRAILATIVIICIIILLFTPKVFAKYIEIKTLKSSSEIAKPIFNVQGTETSKINSINNVGYYEFTIKNYDETQVSDTAFNYIIEVVSTVNESIKFELYKDDKLIELENLKTKEMHLGANEKIEEKYKLKVTYNREVNTIGKDILQEVQIKVHSEQAKIG